MKLKEIKTMLDSVLLGGLLEYMKIGQPSMIEPCTLVIFQNTKNEIIVGWRLLHSDKANISEYNTYWYHYKRNNEFILLSDPLPIIIGFPICLVYEFENQEHLDRCWNFFMNQKNNTNQ